MAVVLQTDYAWPDVAIERAVIEGAGHRLVTGSATPPAAETIAAMAADHDVAAIMTCWAEVAASTIAASRALRIVQRIGVGLDNIDVAAATARGTWVANVPDYCVDEVSAHAVALVLDWARGIAAFDRAVKRGEWNPAAATLRRISDLTVGIVGYGRIGTMTADRLRAFGCTVLTNSRRGDGPNHRDLATLLAVSDAIVIHAPLTPDTHHLIDASRIAQMKRGAYLVNVSRGPLIDTGALLAALIGGHLSGAGLDVIEGEPAPPRALVERADVTVTPHVAFSSGASLAELRRRAAEEVVRALAGEPLQHPCNDPRFSS